MQLEEGNREFQRSLKLNLTLTEEFINTKWSIARI